MLACTLCHDRKVRCVLDADGSTCAACRNAGLRCTRRSRKRRQTTEKRSPELEDGHNTAGGNHILTDSATPHPHHGPQSPVEGIMIPVDHTSNDTPTNVVSNRELRFAAPTSSHHKLPAAHTHTPQQWDQSQATTYIGRDHYITQEEEIDEASARAFDPIKTGHHSSIASATVQMWKGFDIPPRAARQSLLSSFLDFCNPWTPVLEASDLASLSLVDERPSSMLLAQSLWLAGSRVTSAPSVVAFASSDQFYQRAKAILWSGLEVNPIAAVKASLMLQWYNPDGPEHVSFDNSEFWLKVGVGLAHQVGLHREPPPGPARAIRRRLWWSLVARDSLISVAHGRPRAINLDDCDVKPPELEDFVDSPFEFELFSWWVDICQILGDICQSCARRHMSRTKKLYIDSSLYRWSQSLPPELRVAPRELPHDSYLPSIRNFTARQLHLPYLTSVVILARSSNAAGSVSSIATIAASLVARIYEDFLARDEIKVLAPIFTRYCLISGMALVALMPSPPLWESAQADLSVLQHALIELSKRWRSAIGASKALNNVIEKRSQRVLADRTLAVKIDERELRKYFRGINLSYCRMWGLLVQASSSQPRSPGSNQANSLAEHLHTEPQAVLPDTDAVDPFLNRTEELNFSMFQYEHVENWILNDDYLFGP